MFCRNCGTNIEGNKFCPNCGVPCNNHVNYGVNNNSNENNGVLIGSVLIGGISIVLIFYIWLLAIPVAIVGLIFGIIAYKKSKRFVGIVINALSIILNIIFTVIVFLFFGAFFGFLFSFVDEYEDYVNDNDDTDTVITEPVKESNPLIGTWDCVNYPDGVDGEYTTTMVLYKNFDFETYEYGNKENNHIYGTYEYVDLEKKNNSGEYSYYTLEIKPNEYVIDSQNQDFDEDTIIKFEFGIATIDGVKQGILLNYANYNMIYCFVR